MDEFNNKTSNQQNGNGVNNGGEYHFVPPRQNQYYQPPVQNQGQYYAPRQQAQYYSPNPPKPQKKKNKALRVVIGIIIAVVAVSVIVLGWTALRPAQSNKNDTSQSQSTDDASATLNSSESAAKTDGEGNYTVAGVAEKCMDSCVLISVYANQSAYSYFYSYGSGNSNNDGTVLSGEGSGVIMSEGNGRTYIMTCAHVIANGDTFKVTTNDGKEHEASMVGVDSQTDIGVLYIEGTGFSIASFGDSKDIEVGEQCVAIGCPGGSKFMNSVATGIVSALDRPVASSIGYNNECIQTDTAINPGNSGGALFNMQGQVIGINSSKIASTEYEGMGFAVPSNTAVETANSLIKNGYVAGRAKLGITYASITNASNASAILSALSEKGFEDAKGTMIIDEITSDSDLKNKDVRQYDMIVAVNGETLTSTDILTSTLSKSKPGDTVTLSIARIEGNQIKTFDITCKLVESKK